jgi:zinc protease
MLQESVINPMMMGMRAAQLAPYPENEVRLQPPTPEMIDRLSLDSAQAWLDKLIKQSPIEVTIVGDLPKEKAIELVTKYLGSLPERPRVEPKLYADLRKIQRPAGPRYVEKLVDTQTDEAYVQSGFYGADESNRHDSRALTMASRILSTRMIKEVREDAQLVYSIGAQSRAGSTYPGFGVFAAGAPTDPHKVNDLVAKLASMYEKFSQEGPSDEEMEVARKQFDNTYQEDLKNPIFWSGRLGQLAFRGITLDELAEEPAAYQKITGQQIKDTFAKYYSKENSIVVIVKPSGNHPTTKTASAGNGAGSD